MVKIRPLLRSYNETGWSNPQKILNRLIEYIEEGNTGLITINSLISRSVDYLLEDGVISKNSVYSTFDIHDLLSKNIINSNTGNDLVQDVENIAKKICDCLKEKANIVKAVEHLNDYINKQNITYEDGFDKFVLLLIGTKRALCHCRTMTSTNMLKTNAMKKDLDFI